MSNSANIVVYDFGFRGELGRQGTTKYYGKDDPATQIVAVLRICDENGDVISANLTPSIRFVLIDYHDKTIIPNNNGDLGNSNWSILSDPTINFNSYDYSYSCTWNIISLSPTPKPITLGYDIQLSDLSGSNYTGGAKNTSSDGSQNPLALSRVA